MNLNIDDVGRLENNEDDPRLVEHLPRRRDRRFVAALIGALARNEGQLTEAVMVEASQSAYALPHRMISPELRKKWHIEKAKTKLLLTDVAHAIAAYYEVATGFSLQDAAELHVAHIKGNITKEQAVVVHDGKDVSHVEVVQVKLAPNYAALKDYLTYVLPKEPKQIRVHATSQNVNVNVDANNYTPPMLDATPVGIDIKPTNGKKK